VGVLIHTSEEYGIPVTGDAVILAEVLSGDAMIDWVSKGIPAAGLYAGPTAWLIDTQTNYVLVPWVCANQIQVVPLLAVAMAAVSLFDGYLS
jgi:hypothetical protein